MTDEPKLTPEQAAEFEELATLAMTATAREAIRGHQDQAANDAADEARRAVWRWLNAHTAR